MSSCRPFDAVVVLGTRVRADGRASARLRARVEHAIQLFAEARAEYLVLSGGPPGASVTEAQAMAQLAVASGVSNDRLLLETESGSTWDNARLTATLLRDRGAERILLVTDELHMRRAAMTFRATGLEVTADAAPWRSQRGVAGAAFASLYEWSAMAVYVLRLIRRRRDLSG